MKLIHLSVASVFLAASAWAADPLPSWNEGAAKQSIVAFVERVSNEGTSDFVPPAARIATFDNDGTLWAEQPMYFQLLFALDQVSCWRRSTRSGRTRSRSPRCSGAT